MSNDGGGSPALSARGSPVFVTLDGFRGIAAIAVVTYHYRHLLGGWSFPSAYLAVDLFFIISGIVIDRSYHHRIGTGMTVARFMQLRLIRLMPLYLLGQGLGAGVVMLGVMLGESNWTLAMLVPVAIAGTLMIPNVFAAPRGDLYPLDIPCWSLFWELVINLLYAAMLPLLSNRVAVAVLVVAQSALAVAAFRAGSIDHGSAWPGVEIGLLRVVSGFCAGILIARLHRSGFRVPVRLPAIVLLSLLGGTLALPMSLGWAKDVACVAIIFPILCLSAVSIQPVLARPYLLLGTLSYPVYIIHATLPIDRAFQILFHRSTQPYVPAIGFGAIALACVLAWLLVRFYDVPVRRSLARRFAD